MITFDQAKLEQCRGELWKAFFEASYSERHKTNSGHRADAFAHACFRNSSYGSFLHGGGQSEWIHQPTKALLWYLKRKCGIKPKFYEALNGERDWFLRELLEPAVYPVFAEELIVESVCGHHLAFWRADGSPWPISDPNSVPGANIRLIVSRYLFDTCMTTFSHAITQSA